MYEFLSVRYMITLSRLVCACGNIGAFRFIYIDLIILLTSEANREVNCGVNPASKQCLHLLLS